jgi:hypothetical protein
MESEIRIPGFDIYYVHNIILMLLTFRAYRYANYGMHTQYHISADLIAKVTSQILRDHGFPSIST